MHPDGAALARSLAALILAEAVRCAGEEGRFAVALSGGSTPRPGHRLLAREPIRSAFPWARTRIFWVDERCVEPSDSDSNYGNAFRDFLEGVPIPSGHVFPMPASHPPAEGALAYERMLARFFEMSSSGFPRFDLVLLGLGSDGHTASLFPGDPALGETERWVVPVRGGSPEVDRLTLTLPVLNRARRAVFVASGAAKAKAVRAVLEARDARLPAARVAGKTTWLLDTDAASMLSIGKGGNPVHAEDAP